MAGGHGSCTFSMGQTRSNLTLIRHTDVGTQHFLSGETTQVLVFYVFIKTYIKENLQQRNIEGFLFHEAGTLKSPNGTLVSVPFRGPPHA